jgi:hypothetical protein
MDRHVHIRGKALLQIVQEGTKKGLLLHLALNGTQDSIQLQDLLVEGLKGLQAGYHPRFQILLVPLQLAQELGMVQGPIQGRHDFRHLERLLDEVVRAALQGLHRYI